MKNLESQIKGQSEIIFGGKIGACISKANIDKPNVAVRIGELKEVLEIGVFTKKSEYKDGFQVNMVFDSVRSIEVVQEWLEHAKEKLNNQLEGKEW